MSDEVVVRRDGAPADDPVHGARIETGSFGPMPAWGTDGGGPMNDQQIDSLAWEPPRR